MLKDRRILVVGSGGRNLGKTEFCCRIIRRLSREVGVVGVKVTAIGQRHAQCPRGGAGCGVCESVNGRYELIKERQSGTVKDTSRMLDAGASEVYWLRVLREHLLEGTEAFLCQIPPEAAIVCESNSIRQVLEPGMFVVITSESDSPSVKPSCREVMPLADRTIVFDGQAWGLDPERLVFARHRWWVREDAAAIVLAGGGSRRMGQDKSLLPFGGKPLIAHIVDQLSPGFDVLLIGANSPDKYQFLGCPVVHDDAPGAGPLMGILSCLRASPRDLNFVTGCDIPFIHPGLIRQLLQAASVADIAVTVSASGEPEPLLAVYRKSVADVADRVLRRGGRRISDLFSRVNVRHVPLPEGEWYRNMNTPEEYSRALAYRSAMEQGDQW